MESWISPWVIPSWQFGVCAIKIETLRFELVKLPSRCAENDSGDEDLGDEVCVFKLEKGMRYIIKVEGQGWACDECWAAFDLSDFKAED